MPLQFPHSTPPRRGSPAGTTSAFGGGIVANPCGTTLTYYNVSKVCRERLLERSVCQKVERKSHMAIRTILSQCYDILDTSILGGIETEGLALAAAVASAGLAALAADKNRPAIQVLILGQEVPA